jgi:amino acid adenylation domain-containing protein
MGVEAESIRTLIAARAAERPGAAALLGLEAEPLTYRQLERLLVTSAAALSGLGLREEDRVALVTRNGPLAATSFLALAACCGCAPLNPAYREEEFRFYLEDLKPAVLMRERGVGDAAVRAGRALGIRVCELAAEPGQGAGWFSLESAEGGEARFAGGGANALYLHTSGTTSRPKLVPLTQRNLLRSARNVRETLGLRSEDRCLNIMPLFHIHGLVAAVLASLEAGASVACAPGFEATRFFDWLDEFSPAWYTAVPTMHHAIAERAEQCAEQAARARLRFVRSSSASLPPRLMARIEEIFRAPMVEAYGMTEAAHQMASNPLPPRARKPGSVGLPAGPEVSIMDAGGRLLAQGERGEVVIRGENVTSGYAANEAANREAFTAGWFRTGDEGYFDADGYLYLTGRLKEMINRGGEKIAPREIDEALMDHPAVAQALAFGAPDGKLGEDVAAAVVLRPGAAVGEEELQDFVSARLADFKVPRRIVFVEEIPKGPTGKLQRIGMAGRLGVATAARAAAPARRGCGGMTQALVEIWRQVLRREDAGPESHFFELGGDSILAAQAMARVNALTGGAYSVMHLYRAPTPAALAGAVRVTPKEPAGEAAGGLRLSPAQERMLFLHECGGEPRLFNRPAYLRLSGWVDRAAMRAALEQVVARHAALRTGFRREGPGWQAVVAEEAECGLEWRDLRASADAAAEAGAAAAELFAEPFDLARPPLMKALLMQIGDREFRLAVSMHHLVSDGWSSRVVFRDLFEFYNARQAGRGAKLPEIETSYAEYVRMLEREQAEPGSGGSLEYWRKELEGAPALLNVPLDFARPARQSYRSADVVVKVDGAVGRALRAVASEQGASLFMVLMAAFQGLLARISGVTDVVVGFPVAGRWRPEFEPLCGNFAGMLPLRGDLAGNPAFSAHLARVRESVLGAMAHQDFRFERLLEVLQVERASSHAPLVQAIFQLRNVPVEMGAPEGCEVEPLECATGLSGFDLSMEARETRDGLECKLTYLVDLFRAASAREMVEAYACLLRSIAAAPAARIGDLRLQETEKEKLWACWHGEVRPIGEPMLYRILETAAGRPDKAAFVCGNASISFAGYVNVARRTASLLRGAGVAPGSRVALMARRSEKLPAYLLGIWMAGCCAVPVSPGWPAQRVSFVLEDSGAGALLADGGSGAGLGAAPCRVLALEELPLEGVEGPVAALKAESAACVLYTSGSTGRPKGVEVLHGGIRNVLDWLARMIPLGADDVFVNVVSFTFDVSYSDLYLAPALGATTYVAVEEETQSGRLLARLLEESGATYMNATPTTFRALLEEGWSGSARLKAVSTGEALDPQLAVELLPRTKALWNAYGPTETTDASTGGRVPAGCDPMPLGEPVDNTELYILDAWGKPVLPGFPGELYIGGAGVASGYVNRPELTAERFVMVETAAGRRRVYRTGDKVRRRPGGVLEYLGRLDHQVKVRGHRVELGEVEAAVLGVAGVGRAVVVLQKRDGAEARMAAFYSPEPGLAPSPAEVREALRERLPEYMVPGLIHRLEEWPRTSSGKIDRNALEALCPSAEREAKADATLTPEEARILGLFCEVLGRGDLGPDDDFFDAGGHSLLAVRLVNLLGSRLNGRIALREFFENATPRAVAARLEARHPDGGGRAGKDGR